MALTRISVTVPRELVAAADRQARALDRSRSWIVAEALRSYVESVDSAASGRPRGRAVRETPLDRYRAGLGLGASRAAQLEADMALTPEARVREAEATAALSELRGSRWQADRVLMFDRYEDYLAWERWAELTPP